MSQDPRDIAKDIVTLWSSHVSHLADPEWGGEDLAKFMDIVDFLPDEFEDADESIRSSLILIQGLNALLGRGLDAEDHEIVQEALSTALSRLGEKVNIPVPAEGPYNSMFERLQKWTASVQNPEID